MKCISFLEAATYLNISETCFNRYIKEIKQDNIFIDYNKKNIFYYNNIEIDKFIKLIQSHIFTIEEVSIIFNIDSKYVLDFINLYASKHNIKINIYTINKNIIMIVKTLLERNIEQYIKNKKINKQIQEIIKYIELEINEYIKNNNDMNLNYLEKKLKISNKTINNLLINI